MANIACLFLIDYNNEK